jgi:hypothetical protein
LKNGGQLSRIRIGILRGGVDRLVHRAVLDRESAIAMQNIGRKSVLSHSKILKKTVE